MKCEYEQRIFIHYELTTFHTGYIVKMSRNTEFGAHALTNRTPLPVET